MQSLCWTPTLVQGKLVARRGSSLVQQKAGIPERKNVRSLTYFNSESKLSHSCIPGSMTLTLWCTAWSQLKSAYLRLKYTSPSLERFNFFSSSKLVLFGKMDSHKMTVPQILSLFHLSAFSSSAFPSLPPKVFHDQWPYKGAHFLPLFGTEFPLFFRQRQRSRNDQQELIGGKVK